MERKDGESGSANAELCHVCLGKDPPFCVLHSARCLPSLFCSRVAALHVCVFPYLQMRFFISIFSFSFCIQMRTV